MSRTDHLGVEKSPTPGRDTDQFIAPRRKSAISNKGNASWWFDEDEKHNPIRLVKPDLVNAIGEPEPKPFDSFCDSLDWVALQWATTEGAGGWFGNPTDLSKFAREQLADILRYWLGELGYSAHSLSALVSEGCLIRNYKRQPPEKPPSPVHDWIDVYRTLFRQDKQDRSHETFKAQGSRAQKSEGMSEVMSGDTQELISKFVNLLARDPSAARILRMALSSDIGTGHERFRRNFSRILRSYSRQLRRSLEKDGPDDNDPSYGRAIAFVSRRAPQASHRSVKIRSG